MKPATHLIEEDGTHSAACYPCKLRSVSFAPSAMPYRYPEAARGALKDPLLEKDREAYRRLRRNGEQPKHVEGSAKLETIAETSAEISSGLIMTKEGQDLLDTKAHRRQYAELMDDLPAKPLVRTSPNDPKIHS